MFPNIHVSVESGADGPVLVKTTQTEEGIARLDHEAERLDRAAHPGVVQVLDHSEGRLVLAWAGGQTLVTYQAPFPQLAAVLASLSATVADLHDLGIVHGAIQADHVVIGADGRPRLCGFGGPGGRADRIGPADDVASVGQLITDLVGDTTEIEPIPDRRWGRRRWSGYLRRSLLTLADQATDADAAHRPTARTLAASIADAVPDARIEPAPPPDPPSIVPIEPQASRNKSPRAGDASAEVGVDVEVEVEVRPLPDPTLDDPTVTAEPAAHERTSPIRSEADDPLILVDHVAPMNDRDDRDTGDGGTAGEAEAAGDGPVSAEQAARFETVLGLRTERCRPTADTAAAEVDRLRPEAREHPTRNAGSRPDTTRPWRTGAWAAATAAILVVLGIALRPDDGGGTSTAQPPAAPPATSAPPAPLTGDSPPTAVVSEATTCVEVGGVVADVDGDGCREPVTIDATVITAGRQSFEVGEAGDALSLGDWDCDGQFTPGLVRPETGEVFLFAAWPDDRAGITVDASTVIPDAERLDPGPTGAACTTPSVLLTNGDRRSIDRPLP